MVVCQTGSHVHSALDNKYRGVRALGGEGTLGAGDTAFFRHHDTLMRTGRRDSRLDRGDTAARALVARMADNAARADGRRLRPWRIPGAALRQDLRWVQ